MAAPKLFLIDAHALCYRSFFAIKGLATSKGRQTNAVYGFVNTLRKILREYKPDYVAVCFDSKEKTRRQEKFNAYKIQRPVMPRDLIDQMPVIKEVVEAHNLAVFECPGFEADDIIATIARSCLSGRVGPAPRDRNAAKDKNIEVVIVSDDKDMYQLAGERMSFFSARKNALWEYKELREHLGFDPHRMTDFIALAGDNSDNIPGVKGIGEVTARQLVNDFDSLDDIFRHLDNIKSAKVREKLEQNKEQAVLSKELAVLETEVPLDLHLERLKVTEPQQNRLLGLFQELEFHRFAKELIQAGKAEDIHPDVQPLADKGAIGEWIQKIKTSGRFAVLADGAAQRLILSSGPTEHCAVALDHLADWKGLFQDRGIEKVTYDLKETVKLLQARDVVLEGKVFDVFLAGYLAGNPQSSLNFMEQPLTRRAALVWDMYPVLAREVKEKSLEKLLNEIEIPLAYVLAEMETCGVKLDIGLLRGLSKECERKIGNLTEQIYRLSGREFNLNSPKQLSQVLFEDLKLPTVKKTKTGFSTDEGVLTILAPKHEVPALILEYRQLAKLKSTYIDALPALVNPKTGRVHTQFHQTGTETGRLSSSRPNLQNIPIRTELGREIRKAFIPLEPGHVIVAADYSQIELRILAHITRDPGLMKAFQENQDIHARTASLIFDVPEENVTPQMRDTAKRVNFGIIYGMSAFGLAKDLGISQAEAEEFIDKYFSRYPKVKDFMDGAVRHCEEKGFVTTLLNRRRYIPEINSPNESMRQFAQRQAINTPVQGSAADLMKLAMIDIHRELQKRELSSQILITVHDELVLDVPKKEKEEVVELLRERMEHPFMSPEAAQMELSVPIKVSIKTGANWLETKEI